MRILQLGHARKTGTFAVVHLSIVISLGYLLTGSFVLAGLVSVIEPALNTAAHAVFDHWWVRRHGERATVRKTLYFASIHFVNAVVVVWVITGSLVVAGAIALIEPLVNGAALLIFDRWWSRSRRGGSSMTVAPVA